MKTIELTEEHKSKLLEMFKVLFPEYIFGFTNDIADEGIMECHQGDWNNVIFFHWFEFCLTHLNSRINELNKIPNNKCILPSDKGIIINHPVDHLYYKFGKL